MELLSRCVSAVKSLITPSKRKREDDEGGSLGRGTPVGRRDAVVQADAASHSSARKELEEPRVQERTVEQPAATLVRHRDCLHRSLMVPDELSVLSFASHISASARSLQLPVPRGAEHFYLEPASAERPDILVPVGRSFGARGATVSAARI